MTIKWIKINLFYRPLFHYNHRQTTIIIIIIVTAHPEQRFCCGGTLHLFHSDYNNNHENRKNTHVSCAIIVQWPIHINKLGICSLSVSRPKNYYYFWSKWEKNVLLKLMMSKCSCLCVVWLVRALILIINVCVYNIDSLSLETLGSFSKVPSVSVCMCVWIFNYFW